MDIAKFAILSVRLCPELEPSPHLSEIEETLVANHMRIVYCVPEHKEFRISGYSSEPILAEAAARLWNNKIPNFDSFNPFKSLEEMVKKGFFAKKDRGCAFFEE